MPTWTSGVSSNVFKPLGLNTPTKSQGYCLSSKTDTSKVPSYFKVSWRMYANCKRGIALDSLEAMSKWTIPRKESVDITCSIAVCRFNYAACALLSLSKWIELTTSHFCSHVFRKSERLCVHKSKYKSSECGRVFRRRARNNGKGNEL